MRSDRRTSGMTWGWLAIVATGLGVTCMAAPTGLDPVDAVCASVSAEDVGPVDASLSNSSQPSSPSTVCEEPALHDASYQSSPSLSLLLDPSRDEQAAAPDVSDSEQLAVFGSATAGSTGIAFADASVRQETSWLGIAEERASLVTRLVWRDPAPTTQPNAKKQKSRTETASVPEPMTALMSAIGILYLWARPRRFG